MLVSDLFAGWTEQIISFTTVQDVVGLLLHFSFNSLILFFIIQYLYAKTSNREEYFFSFFAVGIVVFLLCFLLESVKLEMGFALGLFAIFGIIRYRTEPIPIKEMTYLFIIIGVSVINALFGKNVGYAQIFLTNVIILLSFYILERFLTLRREETLEVYYDKVANIHLMKEEELLRDLKELTGLNIRRYKINHVDYLRDTSKITLYFDPKENPRTKSC